MSFRCKVCANNCTPPGKARGFKHREHVCPCGGSLGRGTNPDGPVVMAVPLRPEQRPVEDARFAKRRRGAVDLNLMLVLALVGTLVLTGMAFVVAAYRVGRAEGRTQLYATLTIAQESLMVIGPRVDSARVACRADDLARRARP